MRALDYNVTCQYIQEGLTCNSTLGLFPLLTMWMSWDIPTCGSRIWEDFISPLKHQRCVLTSCGASGKRSCSCKMPVYVCVFPGCSGGQFSERQPHGDHHEAAEGASPVPLGSAQTVCFFR